MSSCSLMVLPSFLSSFLSFDRSFWPSRSETRWPLSRVALDHMIQESAFTENIPASMQIKQIKQMNHKSSDKKQTSNYDTQVIINFHVFHRKWMPRTCISTWHAPCLELILALDPHLPVMFRFVNLTQRKTAKENAKSPSEKIFEKLKLSIPSSLQHTTSWFISIHIPFSSFSSSAPCHSRPHPESDSAPHVLPSLLARPWCLQASASRPSRHRSNADLPQHRNLASLRQRHQWHGATEWKAAFLKSVRRC